MSFRRAARRFFGPVVFLWRLACGAIHVVYYFRRFDILWHLLIVGPFSIVKALLWDVLAISSWKAFEAIGRVLRGFVRSLTPRSWWVGLRTTLIVLGSYYVVFSYIENQIEPLPETDRTVRYLDQGWGVEADSDNRQTFYYTPQGANVFDIRYDWFVRLERPWKKARFTLPQYMRAYGFIVDPESTAKNPDQLPVGLTARWDQTMGEMALDISCAACHTGQLEMNTGPAKYSVPTGRGKARHDPTGLHAGQTEIHTDSAKYSIRIDGGQAMHDLTGLHAGHFAGDLAASLVATAINPLKWNRFCTSTLRNGGYSLHCALPFPDVVKLYWSFGEVILSVGKQLAIDWYLGLHPVEEGFGRTDALDRIANNTFARNVHKMSNYRIANAPVSYPPVWDAWKLDYVQYIGSVKQPMARNIGESLGSGAMYYLIDTYGHPVSTTARYGTSTAIGNLSRIEETLRLLHPPQWPEDIFGEIDEGKRRAGEKLFRELCWNCHGPKYSPSCDELKIDAPLKKSTAEHWVTTPQPLEVIGTDKTSALNFANYRFDLSSTGLTSAEIRKLLLPTYQEDYRRRCGGEHKCPDPETTDIEKKLSSVTPYAVSTAKGLQYIIGFMQRRAYEDMDLSDGQSLQPNSCGYGLPIDTPEADKKLIICELDGFGQLDIPREQKGYRPRPLMGIWATPPFLHNGSVPTLYDLLSPAYERRATFSVKSRSFNPRLVGLDDDGTEKNAFNFDTRIPGNLNIGHEFRDGFGREAGVIGRELTKDERFEIIEYLKVMKEEDFTAKDFEHRQENQNCSQPELNNSAKKTNKTGSQ